MIIIKRKSNAEFISELNQVHPGIHCLDVYHGANYKIKFKCCVCDNVWLATPYNVLRAKYGCPVCGHLAEGRDSRVSLGSFLEKLGVKWPTVEYLSGYTKLSEQCLFRCVVCKRKFMCIARVLLDNRRKCGCPFCGLKRRGEVQRLSNEQFLAKLKHVNSNIVPMEKYVSYTKKIRFKCLMCGTIWTATPNNILGGKECPQCGLKSSNDKRSLNPDLIVKRIKQLSPSIDLLSKPQTYKKHVKCKCLICDNLWDTSVASLLAGHGCPQCGKIKQADSHCRSTQSINDQIHLRCSYIDLIEEHCSPKNRMNGNRYLFYCHHCHQHWRRNLKNILAFPHCPVCDSLSEYSLSELKIQRFLDHYHISYMSPFIPGESCRDKLPLHYDFKIKNILIEYQGEQHFSACVGWKGRNKESAISALKIQQRHDAIKLNWAKQHEYELYYLSCRHSLKMQLDELYTLLKERGLLNE